MVDGGHLSSRGTLPLDQNQNAEFQPGGRYSSIHDTSPGEATTTAVVPGSTRPLLAQDMSAHDRMNGGSVSCCR